MSYASFINANVGTQARGSIVRTGTAGQCLLAQADSPANSANLLGLRLDDVGPGASGFITSFGEPGARILMVAPAAKGDVVYLSSAVAGSGTNIAPSIAIPLGICYEAVNIGGIDYADIVPLVVVASSGGDATFVETYAARAKTLLSLTDAPVTISDCFVYPGSSTVANVLGYTDVASGSRTLLPGHICRLATTNNVAAYYQLIQGFNPGGNGWLSPGNPSNAKLYLAAKVAFGAPSALSTQAWSIRDGDANKLASFGINGALSTTHFSVGSDENLISTVPIDTDPHVFEMFWNADNKIYFYIDGVLIGSVTVAGWTDGAMVRLMVYNGVGGTANITADAYWWLVVMP